MESECNLPSVKNCVHEWWEDREREWGERDEMDRGRERGRGGNRRKEE